MDATNLIAYLPFDASPTEDYCGNSWTAHDDPTIADGALQISANGQYISLDDGLTLGGADFTIRGRTRMGSSTSSYGRLFEFDVNDSSDRLELTRYSGGGSLQIFYRINDSTQINKSLGSGLTNSTFDFEIDYTHANTTFRVFINGTLSLTATANMPRTTFQFPWIGRGKYDGGQWIGSVDEFMIYDGVALHTEDFTPPTDDDYDDLKAQFAGRIYQHFVADVETLIYNAPKGWRYLNPGTASLIEFDGVDVKGDYSKSVTGVCFNGGSTSQDCFNTPAGLKEVWIRFDLWARNNGTNGAAAYRIGVYNTSTGGIIGISRSTGAVDWDAHKITGTAGTIYGTPDGISHCLLHIKSHATDGLCELTVNGDTISTSGNILDGRDITPLIIWANDSGYCYFSNLIVSESPLPLDAGWHRDIIPAEAQITAPKLNVRLRGADVQIPLRTKRETGSVTVRVGNSNFYCPATATASLQAAVTFRLDDANHRLINSFG